MDEANYELDLPKGCPPHDASPPSGVFFATHRSLPPGEDDFRTAAERGAFPKGDPCSRHGNSIMASEEDARHLCRLIPDVHKHVSRAALGVSSGVVRKAPTTRYPTHHTLWRYAGVVMHDLFVEVL